MNERMDRSKFHIGAYYLGTYAQTERHVRELADSGVDMVVCLCDWNKATLDLFFRYRVGACLTNVLPSPWGGDGSNSGNLNKVHPKEEYEKGASEFVDHPAVWGIDAGDEPSALDFPYFGEIVDWINHRFPHQFAYLNLYPNYASVAQNTAEQTVSQLGTKTYAEYIDAYVRNVRTDYICYDFYVYTSKLNLYYENLRIVSDACRENGRSLWIVLQINSKREDVYLSENQIRFQANSALAFGAETILWACYTDGWFYHQALDKTGEKTPQYFKMKTVNHELRSIEDAYMKYRCVATHMVGFRSDEDAMNGVHMFPVSSLDTGIFFDVHEESGAPLIVGQMTSREEHGGYALYFCAADDYLDVNPKVFTVDLRTNGRSVTLVSHKGRLLLPADENGYVRFPLNSCDGALVTVDDE